MELELGLALPNQTPMEMDMEIKRRKCKFAEAFENSDVEDKKLRLLLWSHEQPNEEEDDRSSTDNKKSNEEEDINSLRKELLHQYQDQGGNWNVENFNNNVKNRQSLYVKVKMEGVAIGRKIDLRLFDSYQALKRTLLNMFTKYLKIDRNGTEYTILYQDKEGDWLLAGDVPWETFMESVQRMEIIRNDT
ncbi:auxin-responsive IAA29-like [Olea europaea subsp. europaea]|uniref:Auxin-responsive protein n=2 Tax=Olea europaea subsp. europaea TaxID=158383 RepID=A0A8S0UIR2_OLEEU|nr:auxin-responsive IAA29-like [Olea europaea subsp. europaea]